MDSANDVQASAEVALGEKPFRVVKMPSFQGNASEADTLSKIANYLAAL